MTKVSTRHAARGASEPPKPLQRLVAWTKSQLQAL